MDSDHLDPTVRRLLELRDLCRDSSVPETIGACVDGMLEQWVARSNYTEDISTKQSQELERIAVETNKLGSSSSMMTGILGAQFIKSVVKLSNAKRALEIGTFTGYSALAIAEALPAEGTVDTCDINQETSDLAKSLTSKSRHASKIRFHIAPGEMLLKRFAGEGRQFDFIFLDGNKDGYKEQYSIIMEHGLLSEKGAVLIDNAYMGGHAYSPDNRREPEWDDLGRNVANCTNYIKTDSRVHKVLVPIRDGMLLVQRI